MAESLRVDVGGVELYVEVLGDEGAPAVVFGHSLLCDGRMFSDQVTDLARDHRVVNIDFRGHGRSGVPTRRFTMGDLGRDYARVMDAVGVDRAVIVGLSMGGMAAMHLALDAPGRVAGLVLLDTSADREVVKAKAKYGALALTTRLFGVRDFHLRAIMPIMFSETFRAGSPDVVSLWSERIRGMDTAGMVKAEAAVSGRPSVVRALRAVSAPTLVIAGEDDIATPPSRARQLAAAIPGARLQMIPATGHLSTIERPVVTTKLIRQHVEQVYA